MSRQVSKEQAARHASQASKAGKHVRKQRMQAERNSASKQAGSHTGHLYSSMQHSTKSVWAVSPSELWLSVYHTKQGKYVPCATHVGKARCAQAVLVTRKPSHALPRSPAGAAPSISRRKQRGPIRTTTRDGMVSGVGTILHTSSVRIHRQTSLRERSRRVRRQIESHRTGPSVVDAMGETPCAQSSC